MPVENAAPASATPAAPAAAPASPLTSTPPATPAPKAAASAPAPGKPGEAPVATPPTAAPAAEPTKPAEPAKDPLALSWAKVAVSEKKLAAERAELTKRATDLAAKEKGLSDGAAQAKAGLEALRERAKKGEHEAVLAELGLDYGSLTKARLSRGAQPKPADAQPAAQAPTTVPTAAELEAMIAKGVEATLAKREADAKKAQEESSAAHWNEAVQVFGDTVKAGGVEKYEMLAAELSKRPSIVHDTLREIATRKPELTYEQAADMIEEYFVGEAVKAANLPKVKALLGAPKQTETDLPRAQSGQATADVPRTLTNALAAERASEETPPSKAPLSRSAQIRAERAAAAEEARRIDALAKT